MEWKNHIQSIIHDNEFGQQNDWDIFNKKLHRHLFVKRLKQISFVTVTILTLVTTGTLFFYHHTDKTKTLSPTNYELQAQKKLTKTTSVAEKRIENNITKTGKSKSNKNNYSSKNNVNTKQTPLLNDAENIQDNNNQKENTATPSTKTKTIIQKIPSAEFFTDKTTGCGILQVQFTPKTISDSVIYLWEFGDGSFSNEKTPNHSYKNPGIYTVSLTTKHFFCNKLNQKIKKNLIVVNEKPKAAFSYKCFSGKEVQINNLSTNYKQCQWFLDGFSVSNDCSLQLSMEEGSHDISLLLINQECTDSIGKTISIYPGIKMYPPTAFTPDGDGKNDEFKPVFSHLPDSYKILIFDRLGKIVFSSTNPETGWNGKINGQEPKEGIYLWKIVYQQKNNTPVEKSGQVKLIVK